MEYVDESKASARFVSAFWQQVRQETSPDAGRIAELEAENARLRRTLDIVTANLQGRTEALAAARRELRSASVR